MSVFTEEECLAVIDGLVAQRQRVRNSDAHQHDIDACVEKLDKLIDWWTDKKQEAQDAEQDREVTA